MNWMPEAIRDGILVVLIISGPLVLAAAIIGLVVGILQAATQVQEQTIGTAVKIIGIFALMVVSGFWMFQYLNQYMTKTITTAFTFVPRRTQKVLPSDAYESANAPDLGERINANAPPPPPIQLIEPEKIESKIPTTSQAPGSGILGSPQIPKPPSRTEFLPPMIAKPPGQEPLKEVLPQGFQELKPIQESQTKTIENEPVDMQLINLVPGMPKKQINLKKEEIVLRKSYDLDKLQEDSEDESEELASWLN